MGERQDITVTDPVRYHRASLADAPSREMRDNRGVRTLLVHPGLGATKVDVHLNHIHAGDPGGRFHLHRDAENVYIVLEGNGVVQVDDELLAVGPSDVLYIAEGVPHGVRNTGDGVLKLIEIYAPAKPDFTVVDRSGASDTPATT